MQPLNQLPELRDRELLQGGGAVFGERLAGYTTSGQAQLAFRIGYAWDSAHASPRRPVEEVLA